MEKNHIYIMFDAHHPFMEFDFLFSLCGPRLLVHPPTKWSLYCRVHWLSVLCCVVLLQDIKIIHQDQKNGGYLRVFFTFFHEEHVQ